MNTPPQTTLENRLSLLNQLIDGDDLPAEQLERCLTARREINTILGGA